MLEIEISGHGLINEPSRDAFSFIRDAVVTLSWLKCRECLPLNRASSHPFDSGSIEETLINFWGFEYIYMLS